MEGIEPIIPAQPADGTPAPDPIPINPSQTPVVAPEATPISTDTDIPVQPETPAEGVPAHSEDIKFDGVKYGDLDVTVNIPADLANMAAEKGIDAQAISKELYESEDFTLSQESLDGLYDAFGKWQVDTYLSGLKAKNDAMVSSYQQDQESRTKAEESAWESTLEIMGGEDKWNDLSVYASENLSEEEMEEFNAIMENGTLKMQQLMIADLFGKFSAAGAPVAPVSLDLEGGGASAPVVSENGPLSYQDYLELFQTGEYKNNPELYDKRRQLGMAKGL